MGLGWWTRPGNKKKLDGVSSAAVLSDGYAPSQKNLNLNRKRMTAAEAKAAAISPATTQNPFGLLLNVAWVASTGDVRGNIHPKFVRAGSGCGNHLTR